MKLAFLSLTCVILAQNLLVNGGFEAFAGAYCQLIKCDTMPSEAIAPWYISANQYVDLVSSLRWVAWGNWSIDLNSLDKMTISQQVTLVPGKLYLLTFKLNQNYCSWSGGAEMLGFYSVTGNAVTYFKHTKSSGMLFNDTWKNVTYLFRATAANTTISVGSNKQGTCGPVVDAFSLTAFAPGC